MMTEATPPQDMGPASETAPVQSQGHRRRRRRRKNKSQQAGAQGAPQQGQPQAQAPQQPPPQPKPPVQQHHHQPHQNGQNQNGARKKKKFFEKRQQSQAQPGNSIHGQNQGGKRRQRQRGPREFVGPMDHSYRGANGNVADAPPSTIQLQGGNGSHHGNFYSDSYTPVAQVRHDAPTRIFCFIEDLFFLAKIQETAKKLGVKVEFVKGGDKESLDRVLNAAENERPNLIVFDLNNLNAKPMVLIPKFKTKFKKAVSIIGFLSHLQGDLKLKAVEAGCDTVMPRSAFSQSLPNLLRRYGVEEEEEDHMPQPA